MAHVPQRGVERKPRERDAVAAPAQVNRGVLQYVPPHCTLAGDHFRKARRRALRNGVLDIEPGIVVPRDRNDAVRGTQASQQLPGAGVELRAADVHQVAAEDDQVGAKAVDAVHQAPQLRFGTHDGAQVRVGDLGDAEPVQPGREAFGANLRAVYADRSTPGRSAPDEECRDACPCCDADPRQSRPSEKIAGHARQDGHHPCPERPHGERHERRGVVACDGPGDGDHGRQGIGRGRRDDEYPVADARGTPPHAAVMNDVGGRGRKRQQGDYPEQHILSFYYERIGERQAAHGPCPAGRGLSGPDKDSESRGDSKIYFSASRGHPICRKDSGIRIQTASLPDFQGCTLSSAQAAGIGCRGWKSNSVQVLLAYILLIPGVNINCLCPKNKTYRTKQV